jgi:hypothetical protein
MKLKLLIALVAVPSLVMAQANGPTLVSTGQPGGFQPPPTATTPGQVGANQQQTAANPSGTSGTTAATGSSANPTPTSTPNGGKADRYGSSGKATVKGSSQGSTYTNPCSSAYTCN